MTEIKWGLIEFPLSGSIEAFREDAPACVRFVFSPNQEAMWRIEIPVSHKYIVLELLRETSFLRAPFAQEDSNGQVYRLFGPAIPVTPGTLTSNVRSVLRPKLPVARTSYWCKVTDNEHVTAVLPIGNPPTVVITASRKDQSQHHTVELDDFVCRLEVEGFTVSEIDPARYAFRIDLGRGPEDRFLAPIVHIANCYKIMAGG